MLALAIKGHAIMGELHVLKPKVDHNPSVNKSTDPLLPAASPSLVAKPMGIALMGSVFLGFMTASGFWTFGDPISTFTPAWTILCLALAAGMVIHLRKERFFSLERGDPSLFTSNRRSHQLLKALLFLALFSGVMSWVIAGTNLSGIYGFNSVMFLTAALIFYMHIDVRTISVF